MAVLVRRRNGQDLALEATAKSLSKIRGAFLPMPLLYSRPIHTCPFKPTHRWQIGSTRGRPRTRQHSPNKPTLSFPYDTSDGKPLEQIGHDKAKITPPNDAEFLTHQWTQYDCSEG